VNGQRKARRLFVAKLKGGMDLERLHMVNTICLATQVRLEILKSKAKQFLSQGRIINISVY
jgi:hypothetical protein